jgi:hypothetical protein
VTTEQQRVGDLQINQDLAYQQREWTVQRAGWLVMTLILLLALAGLLGPGPLSSATAGNEAADSLWLKYDRFTRLKAPASLLIHLGPNATAGEEVHLQLNRPYLNRIQIQAVTPDPRRVEITAEGLLYVFDVAEPGAPAEISFHFQPLRFGPLKGQIGLADQLPLTFNQFVYP